MVCRCGRGPFGCAASQAAPLRVTGSGGRWFRCTPRGLAAAAGRGLPLREGTLRLRGLAGRSAQGDREWWGGGGMVCRCGRGPFGCAASQAAPLRVTGWGAAEAGRGAQGDSLCTVPRAPSSPAREPASSRTCHPERGSVSLPLLRHPERGSVSDRVEGSPPGNARLFEHRASASPFSVILSEGASATESKDPLRETHAFSSTLWERRLAARRRTGRALGSLRDLTGGDRPCDGSVPPRLRGDSRAIRDPQSGLAFRRECVEIHKGPG